MIRNKKGLELGINAIVIIAIALLVLIIVIGFFTGGFGKLGGSIADIWKGTASAAPSNVSVEINEVTGLFD